MKEQVKDQEKNQMKDQVKNRMKFFFAIYSAVKNRKPQVEEKDLRIQEPVLAITALAVIGVVYLLFCMVQISYLFTGGFTLPAEYSYAGFARQGFFQLLFVSALNLLLVLVTSSVFSFRADMGTR